MALVWTCKLREIHNICNLYPGLLVHGKRFDATSLLHLKSIFTNYTLWEQSKLMENEASQTPLYLFTETVHSFRYFFYGNK